jgi:ABC-type multidrug transport system fused ATPase/permease subunit
LASSVWQQSSLAIYLSIIIMQADKPMEATLEQGQPNHRDFGNLKEFKVQHSTLRDDPFAIRPGKTLLWTGVSMTLQPSKKKEEPRALLKNVWGEVPAGKVTAILGPSGAGKV